MNRRGFTFIEMLMVMIVVGILVMIAVLKYIDLRHQATAASIVRDVEAVRLGAYSHWADHEKFPADAGTGIVPLAMERYLPSNFGFDRGAYSYDWDNFGDAGGGYRVGITVNLNNARLRQVVVRSFGNRLPYFAHGNAVTYIIVGPDGQM